MLVDNNWLRPTIGLTTQELTNLFQTLQGDLNLYSSRKLSSEAKRSGRKEIKGCTCGSFGFKTQLHFSYFAVYLFFRRNSYEEKK